MTLQPWELAARELGDYDIVDEGDSWQSYRVLRRVKNEHYYVGEWVEAEAAGKAIVALREKLAEQEELLRELACSGVELDDERMRYVVVQIGRDTWNKLAAFRAAGEPAGGRGKEE